MAQNVTIAGASYQNVPSIEMPKTGGGTAVFVDTSDANAAAGDITKGKIAYVGGTKITGTLETSSSGAAKETWVIKDNAPVDENSYGLAKTNISFASGGTKFVAFEVDTDGIVIWLKYYPPANTVFEPGSFEPGMGEDRFHWKNNAYKKLTFDTSPSGALLTWLQSNATKQPDDTAVQDSKALTITSNGTVSVTPDAPYDALKKVDVQINIDPYNTEMAETVTCLGTVCPIYGVYFMGGNDGNKVIAPYSYPASQTNGAKILKGSHITFQSTSGGFPIYWTPSDALSVVSNAIYYPSGSKYSGFYVCKVVKDFSLSLDD